MTRTNVRATADAEMLACPQYGRRTIVLDAFSDRPRFVLSGERKANVTDHEEREAIIEYASNADPAFASGIYGPGKFEGANDRELAAALWLITLEGAHDADCGDVSELGLWVARVDRWLVFSNEQGFVWEEDCATIPGAMARFEEVESDLYPDSDDSGEPNETEER